MPRSRESEDEAMMVSRRKIVATAAVIACLVFPFASHAQSDPSWYARKETVRETMKASYVAAGVGEMVFGPWYALGPVPLKDASKVETECATGRGVELADHVDLSAGQLLPWRKMDTFRDGAVNDLSAFAPVQGQKKESDIPTLDLEEPTPKKEVVVPLCAFVYRPIQSPVDVERRSVFRDPDALTVWLNGKKLQVRSAPNQDGSPGNEPTLSLKKGPNHLLIKVTRTAKPWMFSFDCLSTQETLIALLRRDFPPMEVDLLSERQADFDDCSSNALEITVAGTQCLLDALRRTVGVPAKLAVLQEELNRLKDRAATLGREGKGDTSLPALRRDLYLDLCALRRTAAFSNPLLNFRDLLFVERGVLAGGYHDEYNGDHLCDEYYGHNGKAGGGLYILRNPFSPNPEKVDLMAGRKVVKGAMAGESLSGGSFISPDLSFDGRRIAFGWSPGGGTKWEKKNRFRIFVCDINGDNLTQLTGDVNEDDFHPCWVPGDERIIFMSTRRGGYGRCHGRPVPTYAMYSMRSDGTDICCIDWHETNEFHPSIANDGMVVYTRWDYVDRDAVIAHHMWKCWPDGRDPRAPHGNYPLPFNTIDPYEGPRGLNLRPMSVFNVKAIPGSSSKYMATSGPHHGQAFGALVVLDLDIPDDGAVSQLRQITPGPLFTDGTGAYGTPLPLNEDFLLCNYKTGLYLVDVFGGRELIYRCMTNQPANPNILPSLFRPLSPTPLRPRKRADGNDYPVLPVLTYQGERSSLPGHKQATIMIMNVNVSDVALPQGVKPKWLRIVQLIPKATPNANNPMTGYGSQSLVRMPLGVVPIEDDGSVHCEAPVGKTIYFQLLDGDGIAIQSMRSATYVHEGEQLSCVGCHESTWQKPPPFKPTAAARSPSKLQQEVSEGAIPFNWMRLVKPVLESKCAECHNREGKGPNMTYGSLRPYAFFFEGNQGNFGNPIVGGSRTTPGKFGSRFAKLTRYLDSSHYDVKLTPEERRRITLWLDMNSNELGAYSFSTEQRNGKLAWPDLDTDPWNPLGMEVLVKDTTPPSQVTGLGVLQTPPLSGTIVLTWNVAVDPETGVDSYNVYRDETNVVTVFGSRYTDLSAEANRPHKYRIAALNRCGMEGAKSETVSASAKETVKPAWKSTPVKREEPPPVVHDIPIPSLDSELSVR